ncbi:probable polyketide synthase 16 [Ptychodera flava]|uniref:probable polyketide synthase 16 n=1 Tax=Ptychodera flava TaxID=63121 RepID=UPI00396A032C
MDSHQRLMLEVVEESFEDAGIDPHTLKSDCGVFVGIGAMDYAINVIEAHHTNPYTITGISHCVTANRISYAFDLQGPSYTVDTACASSLTAIHLACTHIWNRECKVAVVGGCNTILIPEITIGFSVLGVLSPEGRCCPFSDNAKGYVRSEGWGSVILKPLTTALADDDHIYSVIKGSAIAANGFSGSLTMPLREAQEYVMHEAYNRFNLSKSLVDYVEAHGTGTPVGDPVEAAAIGSVFGSIRKETLKIGSGKSNFGHNEYAAGITAVIKTCLMLSKRFLCPTINYNYPNQNIDFKGLNLEVQTTRAPFLPNKLYRIGVNSFGFSGSVAHLVLEESPHRDYKTNRQCGWSFGGESEGEQILIPLSAKSKEAVDDLARKWLSFQHEGDALGVVAWQAMRRKHHDYRMVITAKSGTEFEQSLNTYFSRESIDSIIVGSSSTKQSKICMLFPGQGQQWISMGTQLYATEGIFREVISKCDAIFRNLSGWSIVNDAGIFLTKAPSKTATKIPVNSGTMIDEIEVCQPAILFLQIGLFHLLKHWGVKPHAVIGHSLGEVAAAYACGGMKMRKQL